MLARRARTNGSRIAIARAFDEAGEDSRYHESVDETTDRWGAVAAGLAVPPAIAALLMFKGSASAIYAVMTWDQIETQAGPNVVQVRLGCEIQRSNLFYGRETARTSELPLTASLLEFDGDDYSKDNVFFSSVTLEALSRRIHAHRSLCRC